MIASSIFRLSSSIRIPAMKNLWCMLNFCLFAETDVANRAFLYVEFHLHIGRLLMLPENVTAVLARNERWSGDAASEPYEAGWAREAVFFVRAIKRASSDQSRWLGWKYHLMACIGWEKERNSRMPSERDGIAIARLTGFGGWLRVKARFRRRCRVHRAGDPPP